MDYTVDSKYAETQRLDRSLKWRWQSLGDSKQQEGRGNPDYQRNLAAYKWSKFHSISKA